MIDTMSFILRKFRRLRQDSILQAKLAEKAAMEAQEKIDSQALPIRAYLDQTVVPLLLQGLSDLVKARY
jgi:protein dpy-30